MTITREQRRRFLRQRYENLVEHIPELKRIVKIHWVYAGEKPMRDSRGHRCGIFTEEVHLAFVKDLIIAEVCGPNNGRWHFCFRNRDGDELGIGCELTLAEAKASVIEAATGEICNRMEAAE